jgi:hypothetical protein
MKQMRIPLFAALLCGALVAQSPTDVFEKAPPAVDQALRDRIAIFMAAHISGKFRNAEQVVHEDSQDIYYNSHKSKYLSYDVVRINYSDNFTKATVVTAVEMDWYTARLGKLRVKPPLTTTWKLDNGQWWWYAIPQKDWADEPRRGGKARSRAGAEVYGFGCRCVVQTSGGLEDRYLSQQLAAG